MTVLLLVLIILAAIFFIVGCIQRTAGWAPWFTISLGLVIAYLLIPAVLKG